MSGNKEEVSDKETFYERLAASHDWDAVANRYETRRRLELIFDRFLAGEDLTGLRFLDAGSGGGHFSAAAVARGADVTSLDVGPHLLRQVEARCESHRVIGSIEQLTFEDGSFDVVLSTEVIEHIRTPFVGLRELCRVVAPGGRLFVTTPCKLWQPVVRAATRLRLRPYNGHENFSWPGALAREVERAGLGIDALVGFNFCPLFWQPLDPLFRCFDRRLGGAVPSIMVNLAVVARRSAER